MSLWHASISPTQCTQGDSELLTRGASKQIIDNLVRGKRKGGRANNLVNANNACIDSLFHPSRGDGPHELG